MTTIIVPEDIAQAAPSAPALLDDAEAPRRYGRLLQTSVSAARTLVDLRERFGQDTDWATAPGRFRGEIEAMGQQFADELAGDRTSRALFLRDFAPLADAHAAALERESDVREHTVLQDAYEARMESLGRLARASDGDQRNETLRQVALEAHRAHAFGLESDPAAAVDRFAAAIESKMPVEGSFGAPNGVPADRGAFERQARDGWRHDAAPKAVPEAAGQPALDADRARQAFGFPDSPLNERDRDRYTEVQNAGEPHEARTMDVIGREYSAVKKALDIDPNDVAAQRQLADLDRELDLYPFKKMLGNVAFGKGFEKATGLDRVIRFAGKRVKTVMELYELCQDLHEFDRDRKEADAIRNR